jgi:DNA-binding transcriptional MerR regulator
MSAHQTDSQDASPETEKVPFTWRDVLWFKYLKDEDFLTRPELVEKVREQGFDVDEGTLVFWEKRGILPRAIRRHRDGAPRALYPPRAIEVVITIRELQQGGMTLNLIEPMMKEYALTDTKIRLSDPFRASVRFMALRLAISEEQRKKLSADTIRRVDFLFKDADGKVVSDGWIDWSEETSAMLRENPDLVPFDPNARKRSKRIRD